SKLAAAGAKRHRRIDDGLACGIGMALHGDSVRGSCRLRLVDCGEYSAGRRSRVFAVLAEYDLSNPPCASVDAKGCHRSSARTVDWVRGHAENSRGFPGLLFSY